MDQRFQTYFCCLFSQFPCCELDDLSHLMRVYKCLLYVPSLAFQIVCSTFVTFFLNLFVILQILFILVRVRDPMARRPPTGPPRQPAHGSGPYHRRSRPESLDVALRQALRNIPPPPLPTPRRTPRYVFLFVWGLNFWRNEYFLILFNVSACLLTYNGAFFFFCCQINRRYLFIMWRSSLECPF